jgi:hypothetical protein
LARLAHRDWDRGGGRPVLRHHKRWSVVGESHDYSRDLTRCAEKY